MIAKILDKGMGGKRELCDLRELFTDHNSRLFIINFKRDRDWRR